MNDLASTRRSLYWDILRGTAILLVIIGHSVQYSAGYNSKAISDPVYKFIYGFHMPLFMLISGYFFYYSSTRHSAKELFINRIRQCVLPIATITFIVQLCTLNLSATITMHRFFGTSLWFLWVIFCLSCIMLIISKLPPPLKLQMLCWFML